MFEIIIALIIGFAAGYGVREWLSRHRRQAGSVGGMTGIELLFEFLSFIESGLGQSDHNVFVAQPLPFDREGQAGGEIFC
jgi:hypothetical protein